MASLRSLLSICGAIIGLTGLWLTSVNAELKFVSVLFRHGDRTPDGNGYEMYPNDPYLHYDFFPTGIGQLTGNGKLREYNLGKALRQKYDAYLGNFYTPSSVSAISSDYDRTKMSLQLVLAGLFPPDRLQQWNPDLPWQPVPAKYLRRVEDNLFLSDDCPLFKAEYERVLDSPEGKRKLGEYSDLMDYLTKVTGKKISTPLDLYYLYHTLMAEHSMDLPLPEWAYTVFPYGRLWNATLLAYELANSNTLLRRLYAGPYLRIVVENMMAIRNGTLKNPAKIYLFSGHETNVASLLHALGVYEPHVPEYSSSIFIELHESDGAYNVRVWHYLGIPAETKLLRLPGCDEFCPLDDFLDSIADLIPSDEELMCDKSITRDYSNHRLIMQDQSMLYSLIRAAKDARPR